MVLDDDKTLLARTRMPEPEGPMLTRGSLLGRYVILDVLGAGGQGEVYAAIDPELDRKLAIKLVREPEAWIPGASPVSGVGHSRLLREAQAMAKLSHPNVVQIFDVGTVDGRVFLAMEYVRGVTVKAWLREKPHTWRQALAVMLDAGKGLAAAHREGIVHRDFKPENVQIGDDGRVRVLDFGLARASAEGRGQEDTLAETEHADGEMAGSVHLLDQTLTEQGGVAGTPAYMAPEQLAGEELDARTDQFSFCVALYEALYGERPFEGKTPVAIAIAAQEGKVRPAPKGSPVPPWLRRVVLRGLSNKPADRYRTLEELLDAASRDPAVARRRHVTTAAWLLAACGAVGMTVVASRHQSQQCQGAQAKLAGIWDEPRKERIHQAFANSAVPGAEAAWTSVQASLDGYARDWVSQHTEACEATRLAGEQSEQVLGLRMQCLADRLGELRALADTLARAEPKTVEQASEAPGALTVLNRCADVPLLMRRTPLPRNDGVVRKVEALKAQLAEGRALKFTGHYPRGLELATSAATAATQTGHAPVEAEAQLLVAELQIEQGEYALAHASAFGAVALAEKAGDDVLRYDALVNLVRAGALGGFSVEEHAGYGRLAEAVLPRINGRKSQEKQLHQALGLLYKSTGRLDDGMREYQAALACAAQAGENDSGLRTNLGNVLFLQGKYQEGLDQHLLALAADEKQHGAVHPRIALDEHNIGVGYQSLGQQARALEYFTRALAMKQALLGANHTSVAKTQRELGETWRLLGQPAKAEPLEKQALEILEAASAGGYDTSLALMRLGSTYNDLDRPAEALPLFRRAVELRKSSSGDVRGEALVGEGQAQLKLGHTREAETVLVEAVRLCTGSGRGYGRNATLALAEAQWRLGKDRKKARQQVELALQDALGNANSDDAERETLRTWLVKHPVKGR